MPKWAFVYASAFSSCHKSISSLYLAPADTVNGAGTQTADALTKLSTLRFSLGDLYEVAGALNTERKPQVCVACKITGASQEGSAPSAESGWSA